jgi:hypothetical protein
MRLCFARENEKDGQPMEVANSIIIQQTIWHKLTFDVAQLCPKD